MTSAQVQKLAEQICELRGEEYDRVTAFMLGGIQGAAGHHKNFNYVGEIMQKALRFAGNKVPPEVAS